MENSQVSALYSKDPIRTHQKKGSLFSMLLLCFAICLLGALLGLSFLIRNVAVRIQLKNGEREWLSQSLQGLANLNTDRAKAEEALVAFRVALLFKNDVVGVAFPHIRQLAQARGIVLTEVKAGTLTPRGEGVPSALSFSLVAEGVPAALFDFIHDLETDKTIISISGVDLDETQQKNAHLTLNGRMYLQEP